MTQLWILRSIILYYPGGLSEIARVLTADRQDGQSHIGDTIMKQRDRQAGGAAGAFEHEGMGS